VPVVELAAVAVRRRWTPSLLQLLLLLMMLLMMLLGAGQRWRRAGW